MIGARAEPLGTGLCHGLNNNLAQLEGTRSPLGTGTILFQKELEGSVAQELGQTSYLATFYREFTSRIADHQSSSFLQVVSRPGVLGIGLAVRRHHTAHEAFLSPLEAKTNK
jgi:hypothetical protein